MPNFVIGVYFDKFEPTVYQLGKNMKYTFKLLSTPPIAKIMPQPFYWNPRVTYLIDNSPDKVFNPSQQKLITQQGPPQAP